MKNYRSTKKLTLNSIDLNFLIDLKDAEYWIKKVEQGHIIIEKLKVEYLLNWFIVQTGKKIVGIM